MYVSEHIACSVYSGCVQDSRCLTITKYISLSLSPLSFSLPFNSLHFSSASFIGMTIYMYSVAKALQE